MAITRKNKFSKGNSRYWFWVISGIMALLLLLLALFWPFDAGVTKVKNIRAGICGAIHRPAVYDLPEASDLATLIHKAGGLSINADLSRIVYDLNIQHDSIYHIPSLGKAHPNTTTIKDAAEVFLRNKVQLIKEQSIADYDSIDVRQINTLYVGFPNVFLLINYFPDYHRIAIIQIPHTTVFLNNDYRLADIFFTLGPDVTLKILERTLNQSIPFYIIQNKFSFINFVDKLGGINVNIDPPFGEKFNLSTGKQKIDGNLTYEFISFIDWKQLLYVADQKKSVHVVTRDNFQFDPQKMQTLNTMRNHRQLLALQGLRESYRNSKTLLKAQVLAELVKTFESNFTEKDVYELYKDVAGTEKFTYYTLPGYHTIVEEKLFYHPDIPSFDLLKNQIIRSHLVRKSDKEHLLY